MPKVVDQHKFESLYAAFKKFFISAQNSMALIDSEIRKYDDDGAETAMSGGRGEGIKDAIKEAKKQVLKLDNQLDTAAKFVNEQLAKIPGLQVDKSGIYATRDKIKAAGNKMKINGK